MPACLLAAWLLLGTQATAPTDEQRAPQPAAYHVGSFGSMLAARFGVDGRIDTGAVVLQFMDGATGEPLALTDVGYPKGPTLLVGFNGNLGPVGVEGVCLASPEAVDGDRRLVTALQVKLSNPGDEAQAVELVATLAPGGGDPERRPLPSLPFDPAATFAFEDGWITRDGHVVCGWVGLVPEVAVQPQAGAPEQPVATLRWSLEVPARDKRYVELKLPGPPAGAGTDDGPAVAEAAFREDLRRISFVRKEEKLRWQWQFRGAFADFKCAHPAFWRSLVGGVFFLRNLGVAQFSIAELSDRPFGHPATDTAIDAEIVGIFVELGLDQIAVPHLDRLIEELNQRTAGLPPERQLAFVHGLARAVRLSPPGPRDLVLANAILAFVNRPLEVEPWHDPAIVRQDLGAILEGAGIGDQTLLPELLWATVDPASTEGAMQALRRAISARDTDAAWSRCKQLLAGATATGMAPMVAGGELDGRWSIGMLTLQRAMIFDDHGPDLVLFPALSYGFIEQHSDVDSSLLPTRFGLMRAQVFHTAPRMLGAWLQYTPSLPAQAIYIDLPGGLLANKIHGEPTGGAAEIVEGGQRLKVAPLSTYPRGMRFTWRVRPE